MRNKQFILLLFFVIIIHVVILLFIMHHKETEPPQAKAPSEQIQEPAPAAAENPLQAPAEQPVQIVEPAPVTPSTQPIALAPILPNTPKFNQNFFTTERVTIPQNIQLLTQNCKAGIAVNLNTKKAYWSKNPFTARPMASISKMMTALIAIEKIRRSQGAITLNTPIKVTVNASRIGGRQVWLDPKETFTIDEILKCVLIHSANDCAYLLAEFMGNGSEAAFVSEMNQASKYLGCNNLHFINSHGLTDKTAKKENSGSPAELAYLAEILLGIPEITKWTGLRTEYLRENDEAYLKKNNGKAMMLSSSNSLLGRVPGVNGMKTGYTEMAGFSIVATCERNGVKTVVVLMGCPKKADRDKLATALINWIYSL